MDITNKVDLCVLIGLLTFAFFSGGIISQYNKWFSYDVPVRVLNDTNQFFKSLTVRCKTELTTTISVPSYGLPTNDWTFYFHTHGTGIGCQAKATLKNGQTMIKEEWSDFYKSQSLIIHFK